MQTKKKSSVSGESAGLFHINPLKRVITVIAVFFLIFFAIIVVNQSVQLIGLASSIHPLLGDILLGFLVLLAAAALLGTIVMLIRLKKPLEIPDDADTQAVTRYIAKLKKRLMKNPYLKKTGFIWDDGVSDAQAVEIALKTLDKQGRVIIKGSASGVFLTTAVSQNGSLDGLFVLMNAMKLVWRLSQLYSQRPSLGNLVRLYTNVFATVMLARQINDMDLISEQLQPLLSALLGSTMGSAIPGVGQIGAFIIDSILEGGLNTLLTLRVGIVTQMYCTSTVKVERRVLGKSATLQAGGLLGSIIMENSKKITEAVLRALKNAAISPFVRGKNAFTQMFRQSES